MRIADIIEQFILSAMQEDNTIEISRNSLADYFGCAPSQINYVLETRFTLDRGYKKESKRGGGGFIKIDRISADTSDSTRLIIESVGSELTFRRMSQILDRLKQDKIVSKREVNLVKAALSNDALSLPILSTEKLRANAFKSVLIELISEKEVK